MIRFANVSKRYPGGGDALKNVDFHAKPGELVFLTGHSGAGKSTLLKIISLVERPTRGQVFLAGRNISRLRQGAIPALRRQLGIVFQDHKLLYDRSVFENVALPLFVAGTTMKECARRVRAALDQVGLLDKEMMNPLQLSTGEQQRVGIARAVVSRPKVIIADEPTGNLDPSLSHEIMQLFVRFNSVGTTIMIVSHDLALVNSLDGRRLHLDHGRLHEGMAYG